METVETKFSVRDGGHYVPGVKHNQVLYISGQLSDVYKRQTLEAGGGDRERDPSAPGPGG